MKKTLGEVTQVAVLSSALVALCISCPSGLSANQSKPAAAKPDGGNLESTIKTQLGNLCKALSSGQAREMSNCWMPDGTFIDEDGQVYTGREALEKRFATVFADKGKVQVTMVPEKTHLISNDVAVSEGVVVSKGSSIPDTRYSMVFVKQNGNWLISNATETQLASDENAPSIHDLSWLIGNWSAEKNGGSVKLSADWTSNKNFILCKYEIRRPGKDPQFETQIVGFDPQHDEITSWSFGADGGFGHGRWFRKENSWSVEANGVTPDGTSTRAVNIISMNNPNSFSWQSVDRRAGSLPLPDTEPLTVQRVTK